MNEPTDYLVAAITYRFAQEGTDFDFPDNFADLKKDLDIYFSIDIDHSFLRHAVEIMDKIGIISFTEDRYAGESLSAKQDDIDDYYKKAAEDEGTVFVPISEKASEFYDRVFENKQFWIDLQNQISSEISGDIRKLTAVPASDRVVTILHNSEEGRVIEESLDLIISDLNLNNEIASSAGADRPRFIAEAKAAKELVRGESVRKSALIEILWKFLREISAKFKEKIGDWGIEKVLQLLDDMLDLIK
ncbi:hypothetical protein [Sphingomonas sp. Root710]|uniref:hypothetical protein n=1 Tax=Sphingomonas sp. Root710 TaxID=1736594 RepID=UPI000AFDF5E9|nr:hypothetical protein [Sphingomonas sp. Root710]